MSCEVHPARALGLAVSAILILSSVACTTRTLVIETEPSGALVYIDNLEVGRTPLELPFVHGGHREFLILKDERDTPDGRPMRPLLVRQEVENFWLDTFPFDVFTELSPFRIEDRYEFHFVLEPSDTLATYRGDPDAYAAALTARSAELRQRADDALEQGFPSARRRENPDAAPDADSTESGAPVDAPETKPGAPAEEDPEKPR